MDTGPELNIYNEFGVSVSGSGKIVILGHPDVPLTPDRALRLAAWLVTLANDDALFAAYLKAVRNT